MKEKSVPSSPKQIFAICRHWFCNIRLGNKKILVGKQAAKLVKRLRSCQRPMYIRGNLPFFVSFVFTPE
jgi:hypothetical protein